ncbi:MAG: pentapeptide repeat-containing protein, partial [Leptolyngbyaceae cyanobacterium SL_5_9]|nr:pentapeptide repeat-containing protein [Leptolyngbyaceae cyanobacterium SL_5_9]
MKASEVLSRYAAGERDFRRANLRGQSFKGQALSGADFSEADIRGANFAQAQLQGANFTRATAGVQRRWVVGQLLLLLVIAALAGVLQGYFGYFIAIYFPRWWDSSYNWDYFTLDLVVTAAYFITILATFIAIARQGFTAKAASTIAGAVAGAAQAQS